YTYACNDEQTDATLLPSSGTERKLVVKDAHAPGGAREQTWHFHSRSECLQCHNPWTAHLLVFTPAQLNRPHAYALATDQQFRTLTHINALRFLTKDTEKPLAPTVDNTARLVDPRDKSAKLDQRARS